MNPPSKREASRREKMAEDILFPELWTDIFNRLPVRTLLSLKCVCKSFFDLIDNPEFARTHFKLFNNQFHGEKDTRLIAFQRPVDIGVLKVAQFVTHFGDEFTETANFKLPMDWGCTIEVMGCVNGLLWMLKINSPQERWISSEMILCNPFIGKSVIIPPSPASLKYGSGSWPHLGFGYDPVNDDYKVVAFVNSYYDGGGTLINIYSVKNESWKMLDNFDLIVPDYLWFGHYVHLDGVLYFICVFAFNDEDLYEHHSVVSIDLETDGYRRVMLPDPHADELEEEDEFDPEIERVTIPVVVDGSLAVFSIYPYQTCVWVLRSLKAERWKKEGEVDSKVELFDSLMDQRVSNAIYFKESTVLLISLHEQGVVSYNFRTRQIKSHNDAATYMGTFVESLLWSEFLPPSDPNANATE